MTVQFQEDSSIPAPQWTPTEEPQASSKVTQYVMKISGGLIKDSKHADYLIFGICIAVVVTAVYVSISANKIKLPSAATHEQEEIETLRSFGKNRVQ